MNQSSAESDLEISETRHLPYITEINSIYGKNVNLHRKSSKFLLALHPEALVNMSGCYHFLAL